MVYDRLLFRPSPALSFCLALPFPLLSWGKSVPTETVLVIVVIAIDMGKDIRGLGWYILRLEVRESKDDWREGYVT